MSDHCFNEFNLVGGTALALKIGHRISVASCLQMSNWKYGNTNGNIDCTIFSIYEGNRSSQIVKTFKQNLEQHFRDLASGKTDTQMRVQGTDMRKGFDLWLQSGYQRNDSQ